MTVAGTFKFAFFLSNIRSCNDSSNSPFVLQCNLSGDLAAAIQILKIKCFLVSTDLKYGIRRCIDDHCTCIDLFFAKFLNDLSTAGTLISNYTFTTAFLKFRDQFWRESCVCKGFKWFFCLDSHHLPVSGHSILTVAGFTQTSIASDRIFHACHISGRMEIQHSEFCEIWDIKRTHFLKNMSKSVYSGVTKIC